MDPAASVRTACILGLIQVKSNEALVRETHRQAQVAEKKKN